MKIALITGANKGLGLACCKELKKRGYQVILSSRREEGRKIANELDIDFVLLDVTSDQSIRSAIDYIAHKYGKLDLLINNAAILLDRTENATRKSITETFDTNVNGPYLLCEAVGPLMKKQGKGRIVNVSSESGCLAHMGSGYPSYSISKTALNAVTRIFASLYHPYNILVNSVCPGWVKTDMGGTQAPKSPEEGIDTILWAAELPDNGPTGRFFQDRKELPW